MVKREKSPEITEDIRLFVVWIPYPLNPNWVYDQDVQDCAKWVAEVVGNKNYLISIHRKPSSRGMILLEISKDFTDHGRLLGEHQWCNFLKDATKEEEGHKTCVYFSVYRTCREANKDGWKPIQIPTKWFKGWLAGTGRFVCPYPGPIHCLLPPEDRTNKQICRHIPLLTKLTRAEADDPPAVGSPTLVVGSSAWIAQQKEEGPNNESTAGNWRRQYTATTANVAATPSLPQAPIGESPILPPPTSEPSLTALPRSKPKAIPLQKFMSQPGVSQKRMQTPAWVGRSHSSNATGQKPPTMEEPPAKPQSAWEKPLKIVPPKPAKITNVDSANAWQISHESWADIVEEELILEASDTKPDESISPQATRPSSSTRGNFNSKVLTHRLNEAESSPNPSCIHSDDESDLDDILAPMGNFSNENNNGTTIACTEIEEASGNEPSEDKDKGWSDAEEDSEKKEPEILCPTHGPACSKKICQDYKRLEWERNREETKKSGQWRGRGRGRGRRRPFKSDDA